MLILLVTLALHTGEVVGSIPSAGKQKSLD